MTPSQNSITRYINPHSTASRIRQLRSEHRRLYSHPITIVMVEGKVLDSVAYKSLFDIQHCHVEPSHGKQNTITVIDILVGENFSGILAIVDDDFDTLTNTRIYNENIIPTDTHDIESLMLASPALEKLLLFLLPDDKHKFHNQFAQEVRSKLTEICLPLGYLKWSLHRDNISVDYSQVNIQNCIDKHILKTDVGKLVREVLSKNGDCTKTERELITTVNELVKDNKHQWSIICTGHDLAKLLCILLPKLLSTYFPPAKKNQDRFPSEVSSAIDNEKSLMRHLAMCYEKKYFELTSIYSLVVAWEKRNSPYIVLTH